MQSEVPTVDTLQDLNRQVEELRREVAEARAAEQARASELAEALQRQVATSNVLRIISNTPAGLESVFVAILEKATRICGAKFATLFRYDGEKFYPKAGIGRPQALVDYHNGLGAFRAVPGTPLYETWRTKEVFRTEDDFKALKPGAHVRFGGVRSTVSVPMIKAGVLIGVIVIYRQEVRPFTDRQVELVRDFANQAVIAIENARLVNELRDTLEQQSATAKVLKAINRSALDLQSVLDALVTSAAELCDAPLVRDVRRDDGLPSRARYGFSPAMVEGIGKIGQVMGRGSLVGRVLAEGHPVHIPDVEADAEYTFGDFARVTGARTMLGAPLLRDGKSIGILALYRTSTESFLTKANRACHDLRGPGSNCHRERAAVRGAAVAHERIDGIPRIPDGDQRRSAGDFKLAGAPATRLRRHARQRTAQLRCEIGRTFSLLMRGLPRGCRDSAFERSRRQLRADRRAGI